MQVSPTAHGHFEAELRMLVLPGCPRCGTAHIGPGPRRCEACGARVPRPYRRKSPALLANAEGVELPWSARVLLRIGMWLHRLAKRMGE